MAKFDFGPFSKTKEEVASKASARWTFPNLGLTSEQVEAILAEQYGLSQMLEAKFSERVMVTRDGGAVPIAEMRALIVFEHEGRDTTYPVIADALEVTENTAYSYIRNARQAVLTAFGLDILTTGECVRLVNQQSAIDAAQRVIDVFDKHMLPAMAKAEACVHSLQRMNQSPAIAPAAAIYLEAQRQVRALNAAG
jgi:hypothetical protein